MSDTLFELLTQQIQDSRMRQANLVREGQDKLLQAETIGAEAVRMENILDRWRRDHSSAVCGEEP